MPRLSTGTSREIRARENVEAPPAIDSFAAMLAGVVEVVIDDKAFKHPYFDSRGKRCRVTNGSLYRFWLLGYSHGRMPVEGLAYGVLRIASADQEALIV
jgi:hypothetical protein